ncbi:MAG TPA: hypothetical protein VG734_10605, partial [Lacunisphaera sp.]|nr:hypothetical protein [Lacunisphaera sp.]
WQGEVMRIIANAEDEANRNGFVNWDEENDCDIDLFVDRLCGDSTFDPDIQERIRSCAARIKKAGANTKLLMPTKEEWDFMHFRAVDWCDAHPDPIPRREDQGYVGHD